MQVTFTYSFVVVLKIFSFDPHHLGKWSILSYIFPLSWNINLVEQVVAWKTVWCIKTTKTNYCSKHCANKNAGIIRSCFPQKGLSLFSSFFFVPRCSMYGLLTYIWGSFGGKCRYNKYTFHTLSIWGCHPSVPKKSPGARCEGTCHRITCGL